MNLHKPISFTAIAIAFAAMLGGCATTDGAALKNASCDRTCLSAAITSYADALLAHDPSKLPLAENVKFTEDYAQYKVGESPLWKGASRPRDYRQDFIDVRQGVAGSHIMLEEYGVPVMLVLRMKLADGKIAEIETQVTRNQTEGVIFNIDALEKASAAMAYVPTREQRMSRANMIKVAEHYPKGLLAGSFVAVNAPFADDAYRFENGNVMAGPQCTRTDTCKNMKAQPIGDGRGSFQQRLAAVDEEMQIVWYRLSWARGESTRLVVWEAFKVYGGELHGVEAFMKLMPRDEPTGWGDVSGPPPAVRAAPPPPGL
ncbi:MAG: hypothetical protein Q8R02_09765 [Hyphomonadaceae bacterium]|nr:hypothetical protein [Hyphomonadaceae bacterium]